MIENRLLANIVKVMLIFLIAVIALGVGLVLIFMPMTIKSDVIEVPDVRGKSLADSIETLQEYRLNAEIDSYKNSYSVPEGYVIEQYPPPKFKVKKNKSIRLVLSSGAEKIEVPDLTGKLLRDAEPVLTSASFQMGIKSIVYSDDYPSVNTVIAQTPLPKSIAKRGAKINLLLSNGVQPKILLMPDLKGMKLNDIREDLERNGLEISKITFKLNPNFATGTILTQIPKANRLIGVGQKIGLEVSGSSTASSGSRRPVVIEYQVTQGGSEQKHIRIILKDSRGSKKIVDDFFLPGKTITQLDFVIGDATIIVYEDDMENPIKKKEL